MTPHDLETLRGLVELAQLVRPDPWMIVSDWHRYGVMQENHPHQRVVCTVNQRPVELQGRKIDPIDYVGADRIHAEFIAASRKAIPALTALLADYSAILNELSLCSASWKLRAKDLEYKNTLMSGTFENCAGDIDVLREKYDPDLRATLSEGERG